MTPKVIPQKQLQTKTGSIIAQKHQHVRDPSIHHTHGSCSDTLSEVLGREHALGAPQDGVLRCIVRMLFGRDLQDGRDRLQMGVDGVTDHLGDELVNQDDANVVSCQEAPGGRKRNVI